MSRPPQVLVTRPEPGLHETMYAVAAIGYQPVAAPLLRIRTRQPGLPERVQAILLTSGQAADPLAGMAPALLGCRLLAVGDVTMRRAVEAGFRLVETASGDASALADRVVGSLRPEDGPLLLACGLGQGTALAQRLRVAGFRVFRRCVYEAVATTTLPATVTAALSAGHVEAILFFSPDTAAAFMRLLPDGLRPALAGVRALAISPRTALPLRKLTWRCVEAASNPNAAALLSLLRAV